MQANYQEFIITILETSDLHGHILPIHYGNNSFRELGLAKIATLIRKERQHNTHTMLVDNGDLIQGTPLTYHHAKVDSKKTNPMVLILNALQYDAGVIGNHEFNYGKEILDKAVKESHFPWLSANIADKAAGAPYFGQPYVIKQYEHGIKVGLLGLTTSYIPHWENPNHMEGIDFQDVVATAHHWVQHLREVEGVDVVVAAYHGGFERDLESGLPSEPLTGENQGYRLCMEVEGIDVLLTGHQHRMIAAEVNGVAVLQPGYQGCCLGKAEVRLELQGGRWVVKGKTTELLSVEGVEPASDLLALVQPYETPTQHWLDQPIGHVTGDMRITNPMSVRTREHTIIEFINKVQMHYAGVEISNTALFDNESAGFQQDITVRDVVSNYMYPNTLKVIRVTGQDIIDALEQTAGYFAPYDGHGYKVSDAFSAPKPQHYNYDMWEGIEYQINISRPLGRRVTWVHVQGKPIELDAEFDVAMNNYRAAGGGNYNMFQGKQVIRDIPTDISELITSYILEKGTIEATVNANWEVVHD